MQYACAPDKDATRKVGGPRLHESRVEGDRPPQRRTRVLIACSTLHIGGAEAVAACLAEGIDTSKFEVTACYLKENGVVGESMLANGVDLVPIPGFRPGGQDRLTSIKLMRLVRRRAIEVLHTHDVHGLMDGTICRRLNPRLRHVHTFHFGNYPLRDHASARAERICWRSPDALVAVGHAQADALRSMYGIPDGRLRVIWNGIPDLTPAAPCEVSARINGGSRPVIASISTLIEQKGLPQLLEAAKILKDEGLAFRLVVAGQGVLRPSLEQRAQELGLAGHIEFLGWVTDAARRVLPACDIFVQSSLWEAMSVVVLEAMAAGKPMVVTRVGENAHAVVDGTSGLVVSPGDSRALAEGIARLLRNPGEAQSFAAEARRRYLAHFTSKPMMAAYESLYADLAAGAEARGR